MAGYTSVFAKRVADNCGGLTGESDSGNPVAFDPITIATLITTILPMITQWFQACRERRQQRQQDQTPQQLRNRCTVPGITLGECYAVFSAAGLQQHHKR